MLYVAVQGLVHRLLDYGVPEGNIYGIRNGFPGFYGHSSKPVSLSECRHYYVYLYEKHGLNGYQ